MLHLNDHLTYPIRQLCLCYRILSKISISITNNSSIISFRWQHFSFRNSMTKFEPNIFFHISFFPIFLSPSLFFSFSLVLFKTAVLLNITWAPLAFKSISHQRGKTRRRHRRWSRMVTKYASQSRARSREQENITFNFSKAIEYSPFFW